MLRIITGMIALLYAFVAFGQTQADTIKVYFEVNRDKYNPDLFDNASVMEPFIEKVDSANSAGAIERIDIYGYSSPEGSHQRNQRLSDRRCRAIADYIITRTGVDPSKVTAQGMGEAWGELRAMVEANPDMPYRNRVLDIIDNTPEWIFDSNGRIIGGRKKRLMDLAGGRPYRWLLANIFPKLRYALTVSVQYVVIEEVEEIIELIDTVSIDEPVVIDEPIIIDETVLEPDTAIVDEPLLGVLADVDNPLHRLAVKTNLLYYGALLPNIELEYLCGERWSVALEADVAWYNRESTHKAYRLAIGSPEVRYWPIVRERWHGMYVGAFAGGALFDFENGGIGYQGPCAFTGLSVGYMWKIGRHFSLEAGLGAGYMRIHAKKYQPMDGHYVYLQTKNIDYFGPLKLKLSLAWHLNGTFVR